MRSKDVTKSAAEAEYGKEGEGRCGLGSHLCAGLIYFKSFHTLPHLTLVATQITDADAQRGQVPCWMPPTQQPAERSLGSMAFTLGVLKLQ